MLAGVGTVGLLCVAIKTAMSWREQFRSQYRKDTVDDYFKAHHHLMSIIIKIAVERKAINKTQNKLEKNADENMLILETTRRQFKFSKLKLKHLYNYKNLHGDLTLQLIENLRLGIEDPLSFDATVSKINEISLAEIPLIEKLTDFIDTPK